MFRKLKLLCFLVGGYKLAELGFHSFQGVQTYYLSSQPDLKTRYGSDSYALVSDSQTLLGKEFSKVLASANQNLLLLGPNQSELSKLQAELQLINPNIDIKTLEVDFRAEDPGYFEDVGKKIEDIDVGLFVNASEPGALAANFEESSLESIKSEVLRGLLPHSVLIAKLLSRFQARASNSALITVSSAIGNLSGPYFSIAAGNMSFLSYLTRSLAYEVDDKVDVLLVTPGPVRREGVYGEYEGFSVSGEEVARNSLRNLGGKKWIIGSARQAMLYYAMERFPRASETLMMVRGLMNIQGNRQSREIRAVQGSENKPMHESNSGKIKI